MQNMAAMAKGAEIPDGKDSWKQMCTADSWSDVKLACEKHLLPVIAEAMNALIIKVGKHHQQYMDVCAKHQVERAWAECVAALQAARVFSSCHSLAKAYVANTEDLGAMRRITRDEMQKLKRLGFAATDFPAGMQARVSAAMKGKSI